MEETTTIKELYDDFDLSIRAYNVCIRANIITIDDLREHYNKYANFLNIQNCGLKTNKELEQLVTNFKKKEKDVALPIKTDAPPKKNISDKVFKLLISQELEKLSIRSQNGILQYFGNQIPSADRIKAAFIDTQFEPLKIRNIGKKSLDEVKDFIASVMDIYALYAEKDLSESEKVAFDFFDCTGFKLGDNEELLQKFQDRKFPLLPFIKDHLQEILNVDDIDLFIFRNYFELNDSSLTLDEIGEKYELSRERIRQRRDSVIEVASSRIKVCVPLISYCGYTLSDTHIYRINSENLAPDKLKEEVAEVGALFSGFILSILFSSRYFLFSNIDKVRRPDHVQLYNQYNNLKGVKNVFLVNKNVISKESILKLYSYALQQLCISRGLDSKLDVAEYLGCTLADESLLVLKEIIYSEFKLEMDGSSILLERNTSPYLYEQIFIVLNAHGKPAHLSEVKELLRVSGYEYDISDESLRSTMNGRKDLFIHFGRTSTYGLREWENESDYIKGGTIRDIAAEFLQECDVPYHISAITEYVNRYRKTDEKSVLNNLKVTNDKRFVFFPNSHIGLSSKNYNTLGNKAKYIANDVSIDTLMEDIFSK